MKFTLKTDSNSINGFHLTSQAETDRELEIVRELTLALIAKIEKITVNTGGY